LRTPRHEWESNTLVVLGTDCIVIIVNYYECIIYYILNNKINSIIYFKQMLNRGDYYIQVTA
jgi:hypothetical protein